jgi:hypothetical protein
MCRQTVPFPRHEVCQALPPIYERATFFFSMQTLRVKEYNDPVVIWVAIRRAVESIWAADMEKLCRKA